MNGWKKYIVLPALAAVVAVLLAACGGTSSSSSAPAGSSGAKTVSVKSIDGVGNVLVDAKGAALYSPDQEANGMVLCTGACTSFWTPLTLHADQSKPSSSGDLGGKLGIVHRPNGARQVTFAGKPLYTFVEDTKPGTVKGNGFVDNFGGTRFLWHVAATAGEVTQTTSSSSGGYGY